MSFNSRACKFVGSAFDGSAWTTRELACSSRATLAGGAAQSSNPSFAIWCGSAWRLRPRCSAAFPRLFWQSASARCIRAHWNCRVASWYPRSLVAGSVANERAPSSPPPAGFVPADVRAGRCHHLPAGTGAPAGFAVPARCPATGRRERSLRLPDQAVARGCRIARCSTTGNCV